MAQQLERKIELAQRAYKLIQEIALDFEHKGKPWLSLDIGARSTVDFWKFNAETQEGAQHFDFNFDFVWDEDKVDAFEAFLAEEEKAWEALKQSWKEKNDGV